MSLDLTDNKIRYISSLSGLTSLRDLGLSDNPLNVEAYCTYLPLIEDNNPRIDLDYDPNPYPPEDCLDDDEDRLPDGLFSIEGTRWGYCHIVLYTSEPFITTECGSLGFYQGAIYSCIEESNCSLLPDDLFTYSYYDLLVFSIVNITFPRGSGSEAIILLPYGLGFSMAIHSNPGLFSSIGIMFRVDNDWIPPEFE
jgi:hypothetical protein